MLSNRGEIVCIPKEEEVFSAAIVGSSGCGKSILLNLLVGSLFHHFKANVSNMNDLSNESYKWSEPMKNKDFNEFNEVYLNQKPMPSPIVHFYFHTKNLELNYKLLNYKNFIKIVLPFNEILDDIGFYLSGVNPEFELAKSGLYVNDLKEDLMECDSPAQIRDVLDKKLPGKEGKTFKPMRIKIMTAFNSLFNEEILDITNPECHSIIKTRNTPDDWFIGNPFSVIMKAGGIPSFMTSELVNKKYKSEVFAYYINSILKNNLKDFPNEKTFLFFDELRMVCEKDDEPAAKAIGNVSARGRINNVGLVYATQFYDKIPNCVKGAKLNYLFAFAHNSSKILNEIGSDFDLDKKTRDKIKHLKTFEVLALTNNKFICYYDGERYETRKPIFGKVFYPLSDNLKGGEKIK